jgi:phosphoglycolate phosphatase-like HAD superfamily hydrolase
MTEPLRLILFDIDGTILLTDGAGRRAIHRALLEVSGTAGAIDTHRFDGKTDPQIVQELLAGAGHPHSSDAARVLEICERYVHLLADELAKPAQVTRVLAGVLPLLAALAGPESEGRALVGLLTGNVEAGAALKLRSAGIDPGRFVVGAYGSDAPQRVQLPAIARRRAEALSGRLIEGTGMVIIGDTPEDVACARAVGARSVAVATGFYDVVALRAAGATHVFPDLADTPSVLDALLA